MFRDKLYFIINSSVRSNKREKVFKSTVKYEELSQSSTSARKKLFERVLYEIPLKTKVALIGLVLPFLGAYVYINSWNKSITNYYNKFNELIQLSATTCLTFYVNVFIITR
jgi:hypothetical protein